MTPLEITVFLSRIFSSAPSNLLHPCFHPQPWTKAFSTLLGGVYTEGVTPAGPLSMKRSWSQRNIAPLLDLSALLQQQKAELSCVYTHLFLPNFPAETKAKENVRLPNVFIHFCCFQGHYSDTFPVCTRGRASDLHRDAGRSIRPWNPAPTAPIWGKKKKAWNQIMNTNWLQAVLRHRVAATETFLVISSVFQS